jgi:serine/threonine-protein kinase
MRDPDSRAADTEKELDGVEPVSASGPSPTKTLKQLIAERGFLPQPALIRLFCDVLDDLELAHSQATVHRDVTSERIVRSGMKWKLVGYGIGGIGTVQYMSPERCQGRPLDARSDTYSIGICLYEAATGRLPFDSPLKFECIQAQVKQPPPSPRSIRPEISAELERILVRALAKNPDARFQSAREFRQSLDHLARHNRSAGMAAVTPVPIVATPVASGPGARPQPSAGGARTSSKSGLVAALVGVAVVVVIVLLVLPKLSGAKLPGFVGMSRAQAQERLAGLGIEVDFVDSDDTTTAGQIVSQDPPAGSRRAKGMRVTLAVSTGRLAVPELEGKTSAEAEAALAAAGLVAGPVESVYNDNYPVGVVAGSNPRAGVSVRAGTRIALSVVTGRATCPSCGLRREPGGRFCTRCGYRF